MKNGQMWKDINGEYIQAHGGCIIEHNGLYYWYGEHKGADNCPNSPRRRVDVIGVSCYISEDLLHWDYKGLALKAAPAGHLTALSIPQAIVSLESGS